MVRQQLMWAAEKIDDKQNARPFSPENRWLLEKILEHIIVHEYTDGTIFSILLMSCCLV